MDTRRFFRLFTRLTQGMIVIALVSGCYPGMGYSEGPTQPSRGASPSSTSGLPTVSITPKPSSTPGESGAQPGRVTQFGVLGVLPGSSGATFSPQVVAAIQSTGAGYMRIAVEWVLSEPEAGQLSFNSRNDQMIEAIEAAGLRVFPTLYVGRGWMNGNPPGRGDAGSRSYPPDDLSNQWDESFGYSPDYYHFIYAFISHYRGHFEYVAIENEANSQLFWGGSAEEYVRLLKTAYRAIKAADPGVSVVDSGFVSTALGVCIADDLLHSGSKSPEQVLQFVNDYYLEGTGRSVISSTKALERVLQLPRIQEQCRRINYMLDHMTGAVDAVNFHFYEDYRALPVVVGWLRTRTEAAGYRPAIVSNEMGVRGQSTGFARSMQHAEAVIKSLLTAVSLDLRAVVWFSADTIQSGKDKVGLFDSRGELRLAGEAFKQVINSLQPDCQLDAVLSAGPERYHDRFRCSQAGRLWDVLWLESKQELLRFSAPAGASAAVISGLSGESVRLSVTGGQLELPGSDVPVFIFWQ